MSCVVVLIMSIVNFFVQVLNMQVSLNKLFSELCQHNVMPYIYCSIRTELSTLVCIVFVQVIAMDSSKAAVCARGSAGMQRTIADATGR